MGTVVGALAAIGGLLFTAVATYFSAEVALDQLDQSKKEAERDARAQATLVTYYTTDEGTRYVKTHVHVVNRSLDPVTLAEVGFLVSSKNTKTYKQLVLTQLAKVSVSLPPCTHAEMNMAKITFSQHYDGSELGVDIGSRSGWVDLDHLTFTDADGVPWKRTERDLRKGSLFSPSNSYGMFTPKDAVTYRKAEYCGTSG